MKTLRDIELVEAYVITKNELVYVVEIFKELIALADPSEYLEEEAAEAMDILRSLILEEINMTEQQEELIAETPSVEETVIQEEKTVEVAEKCDPVLDVKAYAKVLFDMLDVEQDYAAGPDVIQYIAENPVGTENQENVTLALKELIDEAKGNEEAPGIIM